MLKLCKNMWVFRYGKGLQNAVAARLFGSMRNKPGQIRFISALGKSVLVLNCNTSVPCVIQRPVCCDAFNTGIFLSIIKGSLAFRGF
jgi:hypothetical protein